MRTAMVAAVLTVGVVVSVRAQGGATAAQAAADAQAFFAAFRVGDVAAMTEHFADRILFAGDLTLLGGKGKGQREVTRDELAAGYTRLIAGRGRDQWTSTINLAKPALTLATADAGHPDDPEGKGSPAFLRTGDYRYELRFGPGIHNVILFVLRPAAGRWKIVAHWADY